MVQIPMHKLIAVETDGIYTTMSPERLRMEIGDRLGEWGMDTYDEMLYLQNGVYHRRTGNAWLPPKARGLDIASVSKEIVENYFRNCSAGAFPVLTVAMRERFVGLNAAYVRGRGIHVKEHLGKWEAGTRDMEPGGKGKRAHIPGMCTECNLGLSAWESPHRLAIRTRSMGEMSTAHSLPWENTAVPVEMQLARDMDAVAEGMLTNE